MRARSFFLKLFYLYAFGFILPIIVAYFVDNDTVTKVCVSISLFSLLLFLGIEIAQLKKMGAYEYFFDFWNIVDFTQAIVFSIQVALIFSSDRELYVLKMSFNLISLFQAFSKSLSFVRLSEDLGFLVKMIGLTINELMPFMLFFILYTTFFSIAFMVTQIDTDSYERLNKDLAYVIYGLRNSIGDFGQP